MKLVGFTYGQGGGQGGGQGSGHGDKRERDDRKRDDRIYEDVWGSTTVAASAAMVGSWTIF